MENNELNPQVENVQEEAQAAVQETAAEEKAAAPADAQANLESAREEMKNKRAPMTDDLEAELENAMAGGDLDSMLKDSVSAPVTLEANTKVKAKDRQRQRVR